MLYITNAFSDNMVDWANHSTVTSTTEIVNSPTIKMIIKKHANNWRSIVGHADTARLLDQDLGGIVKIQPNRESITIDPQNDCLLIGQYIGPRLAEGTSTLPHCQLKSTCPNQGLRSNMHRWEERLGAAARRDAARVAWAVAASTGFISTQSMQPAPARIAMSERRPAPAPISMTSPQISAP